MKFVKQLASIAILTLVFLIGYYHTNLFLGGGLILCCINYIHEDNKIFQDTFTPPYLPDKPPQISSPPIESIPINWGLYDYKSLRKLAKHFSIPANQKIWIPISLDGISTRYDNGDDASSESSES